MVHARCDDLAELSFPERGKEGRAQGGCWTLWPEFPPLIDVLYPTDYTATMKAIQTTEPFRSWFSSLRDARAKARVQARLRNAELGNLGDCAPVGSGVSEMRIHYGPGYRVYFVERGMELVILLVGGDKSTQTKDIKTAQMLARQL